MANAKVVVPGWRSLKKGRRYLPGMTGQGAVPAFPIGIKACDMKQACEVGKVRHPIQLAAALRTLKSRPASKTQEPSIRSVSRSVSGLSLTCFGDGLRARVGPIK